MGPVIQLSHGDSSSHSTTPSMASSSSRVRHTHRGKPLPTLPYESPYAPHLQDSASSQASEHLESLQQAANYATLSQQPLPEPYDISSTMSQLETDMSEWTLFPSRPRTLSRGESSKTISGSASNRQSSPAVLKQISSEAMIPAAKPARDPFERATVAERLEYHIESPPWHTHQREHGQEGCTDAASLMSSQGASSDGVTQSEGSSTHSLSAYSEDQQAPSSPRRSQDGSLPRVASPDSWRCLLPEDDPYFVSEEELSSPERRANRRSTLGNFTADDDGADRLVTSSSPSSSNKGNGSGTFATASSPSRRYSSASSLVNASRSFALLPPIAMTSKSSESSDDWPADSWRSGLSAASASAASPSQASPSVNPCELSSSSSSSSSALPSYTLADPEHPRSSSGRTLRKSFGGEARRPVSFSTIGQLAPSGVLQRSLREGSERFADPWAISSASKGAASEANRADFTPVNKLPSSDVQSGIDCRWSPTMSFSSLSPSSVGCAPTAMENSEEREKWPCSRNARHDYRSLDPGSVDNQLNFRRHSLNPAALMTGPQRHKLATTTIAQRSPLVTTTTSSTSTAKGPQFFSPVAGSSPSADLSTEQQKEDRSAQPSDRASVVTTTITTTTTIQHVQS